jgi:hypothetical protein
MRAILRVVLVVLVSGFVVNTARAEDRVVDLLGWVPARTNMVLFVDADALAKTPIAKKEKWGQSNEPVSGLDTLPPGLSELVIATQFDPASGMNGEVIVGRLKRELAENDLVKMTGGTVDKIAGKNVILTPRNRFVTLLEPKIAGVYQPANRQDTGRWLREATGKVPPNLPPGLHRFGVKVSEKTPVILVLDASDMLAPEQVKTKLRASETFRGKAGKVDSVADLFGELLTVTLSIEVTDKLTGEIRLDFGIPAAPLEGFAKPLVLEALKRMGMDSVELEKWTAKISDNTVTLSGQLSKDTANELLSPLLRPSVSNLDQSQSAPASSPEQTKAQASLKYYQAVQKKMGEVRKTSSSTFEKLTSLFSKAARYIDELPILNVDEELLDYGAGIATTFRSLAISAQVAGGMINMAEANKAMAVVSTPNYYYGANPYTGYSWSVPSGSTSVATADNYADVSNFQNMTGAQEAVNRRSTWKNIDSATFEIRRKMVKKYNIEFGEK